MGRKKAGYDRAMVSRRLRRELWERFQLYCEYHVPRTSDTAMLEAAIQEYLDRHEPKKPKKGEKG